MARIALGIMLLPVTLFCVYGFLASFEFPGVTRWKIGYVLAFLAFGSLSIRMIVKGAKGRQRSS